ncbi:MAG: hypothetical protein RJA70_1080 [Pseudomonadota bacterium]
MLSGALLFRAAPAAAAGPLGENGDPIETSDYGIDLFQGPVLAGTRVTGLGGAYVAIAEDNDGSLQNPAAPAVRPFYSFTHFDYYPAIGLTLPGTLSSVDFFNSGAKTRLFNAPENFVFVTPALNLQWGTFGLGFTLELQNYSFEQKGVAVTDAEQSQLGATIGTTHLQLANAFWDGQLSLGLGARLVSLTVDTSSGLSQGRETLTREGGVFSTGGSGFELGMVWRPNDRPYRIGVAYRTQIVTEASFSENLLPDAAGDVTLESGADLFLPKRVSVPWDLNAGVAFQLGARPFNPRFRSLESYAERQWLQHRLRELDREARRDERLLQAVSDAERAQIWWDFERQQEQAERAWARIEGIAEQELRERWRSASRFYLLISTSVLVSGAVVESVGVDSFLLREVNRSGEGVSLSPRLGLESEVWPDLIKLRAGSYLEPTRFRTSRPRPHGTAGFDLRVGTWDVFGWWPRDYVWRVSAAIDVAPRYYSWGVSFGGWYPRSRDQSTSE